ncbi:MAG: DUF58 domain-containing protein [Zoogloeaceae bacterium]|jgi:uncharacterized protein (DUF58 family)|nr:DUF58 domain-containing protein [Zoogloeaceae bacterium]
MVAAAEPRPGRWAWSRQRRSEAGVIRLDRRRVYIFPTYAGFFYAATLVAMQLGSINYSLALGHALVFLLVSLGLVGMLHSWRNLLGLEISALTSEPVHAGEVARFRLRVKNTARRPRPGLEWQLGHDPEPLMQHLPADDETLLHLTLTAPARGWLTLPTLRLSSRWPLGIFLTWAYPWPAARCLVYPAPLFTPLPPVMDTGEEGEGRSQEGHEDFIGLRERQPADSLRHVAWKIAARDGGDKPLLIKCFGGGAGQQLRLDWRDTRGDTEARLSILTGWVMAAENAGLDYGLALPRQEIPPGHGVLHRSQCLRVLALYPEVA